ncbi:unnamed protein product [Nesidiocoris tenuis]|uniref:Major facilitator superfamily (MFS) profile domain-containing protein n=1 Tax=Nesidiocoris tenuis TaxID=355587 RepID=A0A6H5G0M1_9HEMI|nr:unnamed protein product [Nesidiocoris tenuis]
MASPEKGFMDKFKIFPLSCVKVLNIMVFFGFMANYMLRVNLTIAIVAMVQETNTTAGVSSGNETSSNLTVIGVTFPAMQPIASKWIPPKDRTKFVSNMMAVGLPGFLMIAQVYLGNSTFWTVTLFTISLTLNGAVTAGYLGNGLDIAPNFSGTIFGMANTLSSLGGFISTYVVADITYQNSNDSYGWNPPRDISPLVRYLCHLTLRSVKLNVKCLMKLGRIDEDAFLSNSAQAGPWCCYFGRSCSMAKAFDPETRGKDDGKLHQGDKHQGANHQGGDLPGPPHRTIGHFEETDGRRGGRIIGGSGRVRRARRGGRRRRHRVASGRFGRRLRPHGRAWLAVAPDAHADRRHRVHLVEPVAEVRHQFGAEADVDSGNGGEALGHFGGAVRVAGAEAVGVDDRRGAQRKALGFAQFVQVLNGQFQYVGLFQFADVLAFALQGCDHQLLQLVEAPVDPGSSFPFQHRFHHLNRREGNDF